ncbi:TIGR03915 family putative DNA repair protein [Dyadobacter sediminis]|uniref:DNA metabolism protein n=1 Tax=Dyadobacter sediminis TaxID=1493691 RepID=A0A5R9KL40_9BACT|nr:TIGR03915 family putative DNA repair protein [Dyadobacter sediminis]TLU96766.1 DNA metabolism protein [Dyadobacter sediminis]GGB84976.1 DNA metabolism protein [Dyadobacter sediminis]
MELYVFDGTLEGLLTAVFDCYQRKAGTVKIVSQENFHPDVFQESFTVVSADEKANRVWAGLRKKLDKDWMLRFYKSFLSENPDTFQDLLEFSRYILDNPAGAGENFGNKHVLAVSQMAQKVHREKHRMEAFIRFQQTADGIFYAHIEPDFNVLPLISDHFKNRYADQKWIIYDLKRKYGLYFNLETVEEVAFDFTTEMSPALNALPETLLDPKEELYSLLWKDYFRSTNIPARKNMKLHIRHIPKRYWKYLSEKQV